VVGFHNLANYSQQKNGQGSKERYPNNPTEKRGFSSDQEDQAGKCPAAWWSGLQSRAFNNFPVGTLPDHLAQTERIKVATTDLDLVPVKIGAGEEPFGDAGIGSFVDKMLSVTVGTSGNPSKRAAKPSRTLRLPSKRVPNGWLPLGISNTQSSAKSNMIPI
jgi:hypothetical protein